MNVRRDYSTDIYTIRLTEAEAMELHEFISGRARHKKADGEPQLEMQIANELYHCGLIDIYKARWKEEYDL